jgi:S-formylglutathione hydrolase FrmB
VRCAWRLVLVATVATALLCPPAAGAAQRLITIDTPSRSVDPARVSFNGAEHPRRLRANVLLPDGYDGRRRFPVLFLLHGVGDSFDTWRRPSNGDIANTARGLGAIVVMPEAARGFYTDWWNGGRRGDPGWESFYLRELVPQVERRFRVRPGRRNHAIAGLSMGGFGASYLATQLPGYFGSAASFSGFVQHQRPEIEPGLRAVGGVEYTQIFGPMDGFYATGHNPTRIAENLRHTRLFVAAGSGTAEPGVQSSPSAVVGGGLVEAELRVQNEEFVAAARKAGVDTTYRPQQGVHDWPYWRRHLRQAIGWGLFRPVAEAPRAWSFRTVAQRGEAWGLRYHFAAAPEQIVTLQRAADRLRAQGNGRVSIERARGCGFSATLPFERPYPRSICGRIAVRVQPRRLRRGRRVRLRLTVTRVAGGRRFALAGAGIRMGRHTTGTDRRGRAVLRIRPRGRPGLRRLKVVKRGLRTVRPRVRVVGYSSS